MSADDRSERRGTAVTIVDARYDGSPDSSVFYVTVATLKLIRHLTGSQFSSQSVAEILIRPYLQITTQTILQPAETEQNRDSVWTQQHAAVCRVHTAADQGRRMMRSGQLKMCILRKKQRI